MYVFVKVFRLNMSDKAAEEEHADTTDGNTSGGAKKGKKGKSKGKGKDTGGAAGGQPAALSPEQQEKLKKAMELLNLQSQGTIDIICVSFTEYMSFYLLRSSQE